MASDRERQLGRGDAGAVVADADQADAAFLQVDVDAQRAGIQGVLDQLLDHRGRALDDFAGGNLVDEDLGQLSYRHRH